VSTFSILSMNASCIYPSVYTRILVDGYAVEFGKKISAAKTAGVVRTVRRSEMKRAN
jgi:hypothetical protein